VGPTWPTAVRIHFFLSLDLTIGDRTAAARKRLGPVNEGKSAHRSISNAGPVTAICRRRRIAAWSSALERLKPYDSHTHTNASRSGRFQSCERWGACAIFQDYMDRSTQIKIKEKELNDLSMNNLGRVALSASERSARLYHRIWKKRKELTSLAVDRSLIFCSHTPRSGSQWLVPLELCGIPENVALFAPAAARLDTHNRVAAHNVWSPCDLWVSPVIWRSKKSKSDGGDPHRICKRQGTYSPPVAFFSLSLARCWAAAS